MFFFGSYDLVIKNGTILDGTGRPRFVADIGIKNGVIAKIGNLGNPWARKIINANDYYAAPGFVDVTNHSDVTAALFEQESMESVLRQGVTTIVGGNCGISLAPLATPDIIHGIRKWTTTSTINVNWLTVREYLGEIERRKIPVNYGMLVGHGTLRRGIVKSNSGKVTLEELATMKEMLKRALLDGALGLSTNLASSHEVEAEIGELIEIAGVLKAEGGVYKTHLRNEGQGLAVALNEALRIGAEAGVPVSISHLKAVGRKAWPKMTQALRMIESASRHGHRTQFDVSPYRATGSQLYTLLPTWVREGGFSLMLERLKDKALRQRVISEIEALTLHFENYLIAETEDGLSAGKTLQHLAEQIGVAPAEAVIELLIANRGRISLIGKTLHRKNVEAAILDPNSIIASNGGSYPAVPTTKNLPHPRSFGAFPHFLHSYVRDKSMISWEEAIKKITNAPAEFFSLARRGRIEAGYAADLVLFKPDQVRDQATYKNPFQKPVGIDHVLVNGIPVIEGGIFLNARPGSVLRKA